MILDRKPFPALARRIVAVPEERLAMAHLRPGLDLALECRRENYVYGDLFLQLLALRAKHRDDCQLQQRTSELTGTLRAQVLSDAGQPAAEMRISYPPFARRTDADASAGDARALVADAPVGAAVRGDGGCISCDADQGEAHRPGCTAKSGGFASPDQETGNTPSQAEARLRLARAT